MADDSGHVPFAGPSPVSVHDNRDMAGRIPDPGRTRNRKLFAGNRILLSGLGRSHRDPPPLGRFISPGDDPDGARSCMTAAGSGYEDTFPSLT